MSLVRYFEEDGEIKLVTSGTKQARFKKFEADLYLKSGKRLRKRGS